jgi:hypothetical protein
MLDGRLAAVQAGEPQGRRGALGRPAAAGLQERDRHRVVSEVGERRGQIAGERLDRVAERRAAGERRRREPPPEGASRQAELDRAEPLVAVDVERAELHQRRPQPRPLLRACLVRGLGGGPCAFQQRRQGLAEHRLLVGQLEVHAYSCGSARTRSAMMLRWICCVPP